MAFADIPKGCDLVYYPDSEPGIRRRRAGRGFSYTAADGTRIEDKAERARLAALAVPPAYTDVWISPMLKGHLQATGFDDRARKQYRYHADWTLHHANRKFDTLAGFAETLPRLRRWIESHLRGEAGDFDTALAATLALIDRASLRVGNAVYAADNGSYGATTLLSDHARITGASISLRYTGKGGVQIEKDFHAPRLAEVLHASQDLPGAEIVTWLDADGDSHAIRSEHINTILHKLCGPDVTAKTIRTWNGTHAAFCTALSAERLTIKAMSDAAASRLDNTPTVARNSYIHPAVIALAEIDNDDRAALIDRLASQTGPAGLRKGEAALLTYLTEG